MDRELIRDYLLRTEMSDPQAEALSRILAEMTTKDYVSRELSRLKADLTWRMIAIVGLFGTFVTIVNAFVR